MSMSDELVERALSHARSGTTTEEAVQDLLGCCDGHRVAAVHARQVLLERLEADPSDQVADQAMGLVQEMLHRDVWDVVA